MLKSCPKLCPKINLGRFFEIWGENRSFLVGYLLIIHLIVHIVDCLCIQGE